MTNTQYYEVHTEYDAETGTLDVFAIWSGTGKLVSPAAWETAFEVPQEAVTIAEVYLRAIVCARAEYEIWGDTAQNQTGGL